MAEERRDVVMALVEAANESMIANVGDATSSEVFSAYFTLAAGAISAAKVMGVPAATLQNIIYELLFRCEDPKQRVM
jgi:hypothetical protein